MGVAHITVDTKRKRINLPGGWYTQPTSMLGGSRIEEFAGNYVRIEDPKDIKWSSLEKLYANENYRLLERPLL